MTSIFGGIVGLFSALGVVILGESAFRGAGNQDNARLLGLIALIVALTGIAGGIATAERRGLALALLLLAAGAGFALLGWSWIVAGLALGIGALLTILSDPDRRPRQEPAATTHDPTPLGGWAAHTLLQPQKHLGLSGGLLYVLVVMLVVFGAVELLAALPELMD